MADQKKDVNIQNQSNTDNVMQPDQQQFSMQQPTFQPSQVIQQPQQFYPPQQPQFQPPQQPAYPQYPYAQPPQQAFNQAAYPQYPYAQPPQQYMMQPQQPYPPYQPQFMPDMQNIFQNVANIMQNPDVSKMMQGVFGGGQAPSNNVTNAVKTDDKTNNADSKPADVDLANILSGMAGNMQDLFKGAGNPAKAEEKNVEEQKKKNNTPKPEEAFNKEDDDDYDDEDDEQNEQNEQIQKAEMAKQQLQDLQKKQAQEEELMRRQEAQKAAQLQQQQALSQNYAQQPQRPQLPPNPLPKPPEQNQRGKYEIMTPKPMSDENKQRRMSGIFSLIMGAVTFIAAAAGLLPAFIPSVVAMIGAGLSMLAGAFSVVKAYSSHKNEQNAQVNQKQDPHGHSHSHAKTASMSESKLKSQEPSQKSVQQQRQAPPQKLSQLPQNNLNATHGQGQGQNR